MCPTGTTGGTDDGTCWVQNQNQNQTVVKGVCGSSLAEESIQRFGLYRASGQRMDGPQAAGFAGGF